MKENFLKFAQSLILILLVLTGVSVPLFFLPTTSEFFEYNKLAAILFLTAAGFIIWAVKMILEKRAVFTRTPLDVPIIILLVVFLISSFSSVDQFVSFFGAHGKIWPSFAAMATIAAIYFLATSNIRNKRQVNIILWALVGATTIGSLIAISSYFGGFLPFDFAKIRSFNTLGIINRLALLQAVIIPIAASWAIYEKDKVARIVATAMALILMLSFVLINFVPLYLALGVGLTFLGVGALKVRLTKTQQGHGALLAIFAVLFLVIRFVPQVSRGTLYSWIIAKDQGATEQQQVDTPKEKALPLRASWDIAAQSIGKRPLFGTGPGTYSFVYTQLKPRYINSTEDWAARFDKSTTEFTEIVATLGIFGILAYLLLTIAIIRFLFALTFKSQNTIVYLPLTAAAVAFLVSNFTTPSSFATSAVFFLILALLSNLAKISSEEFVYDVTVEIAALKNRFAWFPVGPAEPLLRTEQGTKGQKSQILPILFTLLVIIVSGLALTYQVNAYRADYYYRQSLLSSRSNDGNRTVTFLQKAIAANPRIDTYHRTLSQTALNAAINLSRQPNLNEAQKQLLGQLAQVAIDQGKAASGYQILPLKLPGISAANVANWEALSSVYQALIGSVQGADVHATNTLAQAIALDPQNPILHSRLGALYQRLGNTDLAQRKYEDSIVVKGDWGPGHYSLALILIDKKGDVGRIAQELAAAKQFLPQDDPARKDIDAKLDEYNKKFQEVLKSQQQNQNQTSASPSPGTKPSPSPSPTPSPSPSPSPSEEPSPVASPSL